MAPDTDATAGTPKGWHDLKAVLAEEPVATLLAAYLGANGAPLLPGLSAALLRPRQPTAAVLAGRRAPVGCTSRRSPPLPHAPRKKLRIAARESPRSPPRAPSRAA